MQARKYLWFISQLILSHLILAALVFFIANESFASTTSFKKFENGGAQSKLIASFYEENGQTKLIAGFEIELEKDWKIYAPDAANFGNPPSFDFTDSKNIDTNKFNIIFPKSHSEKEQIGNESIEYQTYKNKVIIPIELQVIDPKQKTNLEVVINYALCNKVCIPASQKFSLDVNQKQDEQILTDINKFLEKKQILLSENLDQSLTENSQNDLSNQTSLTTKPKISLFKALLIALIGGAILNIMPCVLPVLSIKLLSIINHRDAKLNHIRFAFLSTTLGIIFSFLIFASIASFLKSIGSAVGWGFQFQNPYFLLFLLAILIIFIANLMGFFEFGQGGNLGSILNNKINQQEKNSKRKNIFLPNFLSGILAVLLATPCSAPFVGVAISFALASDFYEIFLIFIAMSLGLALPYLFLIAFPSAVRFMPKPGAWMLKAKQLMNGFLAATAIWLVYILIDNIGFIAAMAAAIIAILILAFFKIISKVNFHKSPTLKIILSVFSFSILVGSIFIIPNRLVYMDKMMEKEQQKNWIKFDQSQISKLVGEGKTVVVDITANWCLSCKANKLLVLNSKEIKAKLMEENIVAMRGDLTKPDQEIFEFIKKYNRYGIPFNIVFGPAAPDGILTSEILSKNDLLKVIDQASNHN